MWVGHYDHKCPYKWEMGESESDSEDVRKEVELGVMSLKMEKVTMSQGI